MRDAFKTKTRKDVGHGGMSCHCCGPAPGKDRKALRRRARARLREETRRAALRAFLAPRGA